MSNYWAKKKAAVAMRTQDDRILGQSFGEVSELVEGAGLENRCAGNRTVGSNPTLSARSPYAEGGSYLNEIFLEITAARYYLSYGNLTPLRLTLSTAFPGVTIIEW